MVEGHELSPELDSDTTQQKLVGFKQERAKGGNNTKNAMRQKKLLSIQLRRFGLVVPTLPDCE